MSTLAAIIAQHTANVQNVVSQYQELYRNQHGEKTPDTLSNFVINNLRHVSGGFANSHVRALGDAMKINESIDLEFKDQLWAIDAEGGKMWQRALVDLFEEVTKS